MARIFPSRKCSAEMRNSKTIMETPAAISMPMLWDGGLLYAGDLTVVVLFKKIKNEQKMKKIE